MAFEQYLHLDIPQKRMFIFTRFSGDKICQISAQNQALTFPRFCNKLLSRFAECREWEKFKIYRLDTLEDMVYIIVTFQRKRSFMTKKSRDCIKVF